MVNTKTKIEKLVLFIFLALFPLGQLIQINLGAGFRIQPLDVLTGIALVINFDYLKKFWPYLIIFSLGGFFGFLGINLPQGLFYLLRVTAYLVFGISLYSFVNKNKKYKKLIQSSQVLIILALVVLSWIQYFFLPDTRFLKYFGWDDHLFRIIGPFLDPGFTGILLVLGFSLTVFLAVKHKIKSLYFVSFLLALTILFTYSRASYLATGFVIIALGVVFKKIKTYLIYLLAFFGLIFILPRPSSEGVKLERLHSVDSRLENFDQTFQIFAKNPVFGVGFNNLCSSRAIYFNNYDPDSHACSGSDSSIFLILATTGSVGFIILVKIVLDSLRAIDLKDQFSKFFLISLGAVFVHSQFTNSLFYPWVIGWFCLLAVNLRIKFES